jgi:Domain of unknown function (DUF4287)
MDAGAAPQSQIRNIKATYGKPPGHWFTVIDASGLTRHNQVVAMLKADHGPAHGAAHRVWLPARQRAHLGAAAPPDPAGALYAGAKAGLRPLHDALPGEIRAPGAFDIAPEEGLPEPPPPQAVRDGPAQHHQPDRPRADPAGHHASDRPAGAGDQIQPAIHPPRPHHRSHRPRRRAPRLARHRVRTRRVATRRHGRHGPGRQGTAAQTAQFPRTWKDTGCTRCST